MAQIKPAPFLLPKSGGKGFFYSVNVIKPSLLSRYITVRALELIASIFWESAQENAPIVECA
jgi:hypothetical protein